MKRILSAFLALAVAATLVFVATSWKHSVTAVHAQGGCSDATLTGNYPFIITGASAPARSVKGQNNVHNAAVGVATFDGAGIVSLSYTVVFNGKATTISPPDTGTYTVNSNCTGTLTIVNVTSPGENAHYTTVILGGGTELMAISTNNEATQTVSVKKQ